jgi:predicted ArsR family transcriptional regulator
MTKRDLLELLKRIGPIYAQDLARRYDLSDSGARSALHRLLRQSLVQRVGDRWMLTNRGVERLNYLQGKGEKTTTGTHGILSF